MTGDGTVAAESGGGGLAGHQRDTVLITGASSGIGRELARLFAGDGADLVLVARSEDKLRELAAGFAAEHGIKAQVLTADLTRPGSAAEIAEALAGQGVQVVVPGLRNRLMAMTVRVSPRALVTRLAGYIQA